MWNSSIAAQRARAPAWQGRGEQAEPCHQELSGSHHLPPAPMGAGVPLALPWCQGLSPHACPSCSSPIQACQGTQALGCSQTHIFGANSSVFCSAAQFPLLQLKYQSHSPSSPQPARDTSGKEHPALMHQGCFQGHCVSYNQNDQVFPNLFSGALFSG